MDGLKWSSGPHSLLVANHSTSSLNAYKYLPNLHKYEQHNTTRVPLNVSPNLGTAARLHILHALLPFCRSRKLAFSSSLKP